MTGPIGVRGQRRASGTILSGVVPDAQDDHCVSAGDPIDNDVGRHRDQFACVRLASRPAAAGEHRQTVTRRQKFATDPPRRNRIVARNVTDDPGNIGWRARRQATVSVAQEPGRRTRPQRAAATRRGPPRAVPSAGRRQTRRWPTREPRLRPRLRRLRSGELALSCCKNSIQPVRLHLPSDMAARARGINRLRASHA